MPRPPIETRTCAHALRGRFAAACQLAASHKWFGYKDWVCILECVGQDPTLFTSMMRTYNQGCMRSEVATVVAGTFFFALQIYSHCFMHLTL